MAVAKNNRGLSCKTRGLNAKNNVLSNSAIITNIGTFLSLYSLPQAYNKKIVNVVKKRGILNDRFSALVLKNENRNAI
jgi:hypothetical protein